MTWALPVRGGHIPKNGAFGPRVIDVAGASSDHRGVDIGGGDRIVRAVSDGVVAATGTNVIRGRWVAVRHDDGTVTTSQHLASIAVVVGRRVAAGAPLGPMGHTGVADGEHLHLEVHPAGTWWQNGTGWPSTRTVDPEPFLRARGVDLRTGVVTTAGGTSLPSVPTTPTTPPPAPLAPEEDDMLPLIQWAYATLIRGSEPSPDETIGWLRALSGKSSAQALDMMLAAKPEDGSVVLAFRQILGHDPAPSQIPPWMAYSSIAAMRAGIAGSPEALARR